MDARACAIYGRIQFQKGDINEAIELYRQSLQADIRNGNVWIYLGDAWKSEGRSDLADEAYRGCLENDPKNSIMIQRAVELFLVYFTAMFS